MLSPTLQTRWDWRAAGNFICGGTGTGLILVASFMGLFGYVTTWYGLIAALFVATGLGLVWLEIGRPMRSMNVFRNPGTSWMTREGLVALAVLPLALLSTLFDSFFLLMVTAVPAAVFLFAQAKILHEAKGIPAWRAKEILPLIVSTGLVEGAGLFLLGSAIFGNGVWKANPIVAWITALTLILLRAMAWINYRARLNKGAPIETVRKLRAISLPFFFIGVLIPFSTSFYAIFNAHFQLPLAIVTGLCMTATGWLCKQNIILRAAYTQGYSIAHTPARGGGTPGPGAQPGWRVSS